MKVVEKGKHGTHETLKMMRQEVGLMQKLIHPNICSLFEVIETFDKFYCVLEYLDSEKFTFIFLFVFVVYEIRMNII